MAMLSAEFLEALPTPVARLLHRAARTRDLLALLGTERDPAVPLEVLIEDWRSVDPRTPARSQVTRELARHFAGLFNLPWPLKEA